MLIENQLKIKNLKLRSLPEGFEENTELMIFISNWLATQMQLEEGIAPSLMRHTEWVLQGKLPMPFQGIF